MNRNLRINLFVTTVILIAVGVVLIYSSSSIYATERYHTSAFFLNRHAFFLLLGVIITFASLFFDYRKLRVVAKPLLLFSIFLLVLLLVPGIGREISGARRWFRFRGLSFQPSELANLAVIIYIADFIVRKGEDIKSFWKGFVPPICVLGVIVFFILLQPDLGSSVALGAVVFLMLFVAGVPWKYLVSLLIVSVPMLVFLIMSQPYRRLRVLAFLNPWLDPRGSGFQIIQSQVALGSGGIFGVGLGHSRQKLFYLPAAHTDFIFSIIGEELGLLGTVGVIALFAIFIYNGLRLIKNTPERFGCFFALGLVAMISFKAVVNIGVSCGLLPTKGLPLPFISYGGTSLIFDMLSVGLLLNISRTGEYP